MKHWKPKIVQGIVKLKKAEWELNYCYDDLEGIVSKLETFTTESEAIQYVNDELKDLDNIEWDVNKRQKIKQIPAISIKDYKKSLESYRIGLIAELLIGVNFDKGIFAGMDFVEKTMSYTNKFLKENELKE